MKSISKVALLAGLAALAVFITGKVTPTSALPTTLTINGVAANATAAIPGSAVVNAGYNDEGVAPTDFVLTSSVPAVGYFFSYGLITNNKGQTITPTPAVQPTTLTVADDADATIDATALQAIFVCVTAGTTTISSTQGGGTIATPLTITCATNITLSSSTATVAGTPITVTVSCTAAGQQLTATAGAFGTPTANGTFVNPTTVQCVAAGTNMVAPYTCSAAITVTFSFNGGTAVLTCTGTGGLVLSSTTGSSATVSGTCTAGTVLTQTGPAAFTSATINGVAVTVTAGSISCTTAGTIVAALVCNTTGTVYLSLGGMSGTFVCSTGYAGGYNPYLNAYPYTNYCGGTYNTGVYPYNGYNQYNTQYGTNCYNQQVTNTVPSSLTMATGSPSVACGGTVTVTARVLAANGQTVADGTAVALAASVGTISPANAATAGGAVTATYTAPSSVPATSVTLRATAGGASNTTGVSVTCTQTTAPSAPAAPAPPSYSPPAPPAGPLVISPPNTGDAGLKALDVNYDE